MTEATLLAGGVDGPTNLRPLIDVALETLAEGAAQRGGPLPGTSHAGLTARLSAAYGHDVLPAEGVGAGAALAELTRAFTAGAADPADPACAAHLHCPPLAVAVAADMVAAALNQSLDSWDQAPSGTALEPEVIRALAGLVGYEPGEADGVVTSGGTESNLMGLLLAREHAVRAGRGVDTGRTGPPARAGQPERMGSPGRAEPAGRAWARPRVLCSAAAHFSVARGAGVLGLGEDAVVAVATTADHRMDASALEAALAAARSRGELPVAVVATAGTTDLGAIDPLPEIADVAAEHGAWLHVDAAYGGGALFSRRLAPALAGLERADSVALDLHKLGWQPVPAGVFLVRRAASFAPLARSVAYLNPDDDEEAGYPSLLGRSLRTTRRPDAFKIAVTLRALGRSGLGALVEACHDLALYAAARIRAHPRLELFADPVLTTVVFRYVPAPSRATAAGGAPVSGPSAERSRSAAADLDALNAGLRRVLLAEGRAVVGRTEAGGAVRLKLTLLNPHATEADIDALLDAVVAAGDKESR